MLDLETTGLDVAKDRIIEIALIKIAPNGEQSEYSRRINPTIPITKESAEITGITDELVANEPTFDQLADEIAAFIGDADLGGYNSNKFDIPVLAEEFLRINHSFKINERKFVDVQNIFHKMEQRTLAAAYQFYCKESMENAHNALYDTQVTLNVFKAQLERYPDLAKSIPELADFSRQGNQEWHDFAGRLAKTKDGQVTYNFGKHRGKTVEEVATSEPGYFGWMMDADFPLYTKQLLREEMERIKQKRREKRDETNSGASMEDKLAALQNKFKK
ncbi:DNA polymerase III PolC-type [compost metagenome]